MHYQLLVRARWGEMPFLDSRFAGWTWLRLQRLYPRALSCILMGNHLHLTVDTDAPDNERLKLIRLIRSGSSRFGRADLWEPIPEPVQIHDRRHLQRAIRYQLLNRCRAGLDSDPLHWPWSTLRDALGAAAQPWVEARTVAAAMGWSGYDAGAKLHAYVAADDRVARSAREAPRSASASQVISHGLPAVLDAVCAAFRIREPELRRRGTARSVFCQAARAVGYRNAPDLAGYIGAVRTTVHNAWARPTDPAALSAVLLCLGDCRLRPPRELDRSSNSEDPSG